MRVNFMTHDFRTLELVPCVEVCMRLKAMTIGRYIPTPCYNNNML